jgi:Ni/Fe-hydrogenase subunit HybB-like protein
MDSRRLPKITFWRVVLVAILATGFYSTLLRFTQGLGVTTALSDKFPWGLWIGFDVLCGVGRGALSHLREPSTETLLFILEMVIGLFAPLALLVFRRVRESREWLFASSVLVITGFLLNRLNVSITGMEAYTHAQYFPKWTEVSVTLSLVGMGFLIFALAVRYLGVFEPTHALEGKEPLTAPSHASMEVV